jgi:hypothetical protein
MGACLIVTAIVAVGSKNLRYDHNLLNLQPRHLESADIERQLFTRLDDSVWFAVSLCSSREELRARKAAFEALPNIAKTEEIASLLPDHSPQQAVRLEQLCRQIAAIPDQPPAGVGMDVAQLGRELSRAENLLVGAVPHETQATILLRQLKAAIAAISDSSSQRDRSANPLAMLRAIADELPPRLEDLPKELCDRFIGKNRTYLLKVYARGNVWNMDQLEKFVTALETVDPRVTGHPVQTYYASRHMEASYLWAGLYALAAVLALLWIDFRSLTHSLLAMVPLAIGFATMCGCLGWLNIPFNPANMIVLPLILGIGVDHGVHLVHLWRQQRTRFVLGDATTVALLLTASTTTASFGALILAKHQGLQSLGQALTVGVTTCLAASIIFFPALLAWITRDRPVAELTAEQDIPRALFTSADLTPRSVRAASKPPAEERIVNEAASTLQPLPTSAKPIEVARAIEPANVTEEEVAALLDTAFALSVEPAVQVDEELLALSDVPNVAIPRRRELPRRTEAA